MMQAGKLDRSIELQREVETVDDYGQKSSAWTTFATVRAKLDTFISKEQAQDFGENTRALVMFTIRHVTGLTTGDRVLYEGTAFDIVHIAEIGRRRGLELRCEATR